jgi:hypothetical protein
MPWWRPSLVGVPPPSPPRSIAIIAVALPSHRPSPSITVAVVLLSSPPTTARFCWSLRWLVVALFSTICIHHRMLSCDSRRSRCRPFSPPIVVHRCHCRHRRHRRSCRCRRATTTATATATTLVELTIVDLQRKRQQQHHHQHTSCHTIV